MIVKAINIIYRAFNIKFLYYVFLQASSYFLIWLRAVIFSFTDLINISLIAVEMQANTFIKPDAVNITIICIFFC